MYLKLFLCIYTFCCWHLIAEAYYKTNICPGQTTWNHAASKHVNLLTCGFILIGHLPFRLLIIIWSLIVLSMSAKPRHCVLTGDGLPRSDHIMLPKNVFLHQWPVILHVVLLSDVSHSNSPGFHLLCSNMWWRVRTWWPVHSSKSVSMCLSFLRSSMCNRLVTSGNTFS